MDNRVLGGGDDGDFSLEPTGKAMVTIWLVEYDYDDTRGLYYHMGTDVTDPFIDTRERLLDKFDNFSLEFSPGQGAALVIERVVLPELERDHANLL